VDEHADSHAGCAGRHEYVDLCCADARAALTAALAVAEAEGAGMFVVPGEVRHLFGPVGERQRAEGWNSCRAATLAGKVTL